MTDRSSPPPPSPAARRPVSLPDLLLALAVTVSGLVLLLGTLQIPFGINAVVGPRVFPLIVSVGLTLLGAVLTFSALRGDRAEPGAEEDTDPNAPISHLNPAVILGGFLLGAAALQPLGFVIGTAIMYLSVTFAFGERHYLRMAGVALLLSVLTYVLFTRGLNLSLPAGILKGVL